MTSNNNPVQKVNLFDMMTPEEKEKMDKAFKKRMQGDGTYKKEKIPPQIYLLAEAGVYFGWQAIVDARRGYTEAIDADGNPVRIPLTMEEFNGLVMAAKKFKYSDYINQARGTQTAVGSVLSKNSRSTFEKGMRPFIKEVES